MATYHLKLVYLKKKSVLWSEVIKKQKHLFILSEYCFYFTLWDLVITSNWGVFNSLEEIYGQLAGVDSWLD